MPLSSSETSTSSGGGTSTPTPPQQPPQLSDTNNYYTYLKIAPSSTKQELSKIKRNLGLQHHPDRLVSAGGGEASAAATAEFQKMMELIDVLLDDDKRLEHDTKCGINMNMRIDDILNRGQRIGNNSSNSGNEMMYVHPDTINKTTTYNSHYNGGGPHSRDDESDDDDDEEEYCPTPMATSNNKNVVVAEGCEATVASSSVHPENKAAGNLSMFGAQEYTQDDINELGFKPKKVVSATSSHVQQGGGSYDGGEGTAHCGGVGEEGSVVQSNRPLLPPSGLIGVANDPSLDNTKAFESIGLKRERSPHLIRQQGTVEVDLEF